MLEKFDSMEGISKLIVKQCGSSRIIMAVPSLQIYIERWNILEDDETLKESGT